MILEIISSNVQYDAHNETHARILTIYKDENGNKYYENRSVDKTLLEKYGSCK